MTEPFATVEDHSSLVNAIRRRIHELDLSLETVEDLAGFQGGYASKILGNPPLKKASPSWAQSDADD